MKKWTMFCLTLLISITLVACGSDNNNNGDANNPDNANVNEENENNENNVNSEENENNANSEEDEDNANSEENEENENNGDSNTNGVDNTSSDDYDFDPNGENVVTLQAEENGMTMLVTYKADGDNVVEQTANNEIPYESLGVTTKEEAEELLAETVAAYQGVEGVTHNIDYEDDKVIESLTVNYEKADPAEISELSGSTFEGDVSQGISFQKSVKMLQEAGFVIVE